MGNEHRNSFRFAINKYVCRNEKILIFTNQMGKMFLIINQFW